jgi:formamidopyrimidine-DNA glycosylase
MPEAVEVKLTTDFLSNNLVGKTITKWLFCSAKYADVNPSGYREFHSSLPMIVQEVNCKGKFIYISCKSEEGRVFYILHSMMLTGRWQLDYDLHCKWFVDIEDGVYNRIWFSDLRAFATLSFTTDSMVLTKKLKTLGPDILSDEFTPEVFQSLVAKYNNRNICSFLMDQKVISGCGNYIKAEVLYMSRISPLRKMNTLSTEEVTLLHYNLVNFPTRIYKDTIKQGFALENDYKDCRNLQVYRNKLAKSTKTPDGRTTYWFPDVQK